MTRRFSNEVVISPTIVNWPHVIHYRDRFAKYRRHIKMKNVSGFGMRHDSRIGVDMFPIL